MLGHTGANCAAHLHGVPQVQLLDKVVVPVVCMHDKCPDPDAQYSGGAAVAVPLQGRQHPRRCAETGSHGLTVQQTTEILLLQYIDKAVDVGCASPASSLVQSVRRQSRSHSCSFDAGHCRSHACCCATTGAWAGRDSAETVGFRSWHCLLDRLMTCPPACRLFRAVCTGTRPGLTPAIRAGKGWRGRRELAPRCSATQLAARRHDPGQTRRVLNHLNHTHHTGVSGSHSVGDPFSRVLQISWLKTLAVDLVLMDAERASGAAKRRRRLRRLRSWWRHERHDRRGRARCGYSDITTPSAWWGTGTHAGILRTHEDSELRTGNGGRSTLRTDTAKIRKTPPQRGWPAPLP